jgi:hypothetical protein
VSLEITRSLGCLDVRSWRLASNEEAAEFVKRDRRAAGSRRASALIFRSKLKPLDVYTYLKARFGEPRGFQTFLKADDSDNFIHWDYHIKASNNEDVYILGTDREVHVLLSERLKRSDWPSFVNALKQDFARHGREKSDVLRSLEKWVIFPNKFASIADVCADLHDTLSAEAHGYTPFVPSRRTKKGIAADRRKLEALGERAARIHSASIQLSLLTPVMAEAFINMIVWITCKPSIRNNQRQFDAFIRSDIDNKLFDLVHKCQGFERGIDPSSSTYANFKRVMDRRNSSIHGNISPPTEHIEVVYFDRKTPLYEETGDHISRFFDSLEKVHRPARTLEDYEHTLLFLAEVVDCLSAPLQEGVWAILRSPYPGYDLGRQICGVLFPDFAKLGYAQGLTYDDELAVSWN